ncbi:ABC transporter permease [Devosia sp. FJ2-5-3]|jgi:putative spermidine/putrescine transport system permease protein|uniref:ABC transporter permease n=1 Tax=Devosia sp. FJ2-5-3 TaxID=2976680 RepID=UPI0023D85421|nr:ABC transporter permease [Devosia sp. FJ2-5-3]WEJ59257.1 ABC transporter permease [Devosia sp. FJ2-5-3]
MSKAAYPLRWRVMDGLEAVVAALWPKNFARALPYVMVLPAILLVMLLVIGLIQIGDSSARTLDRSTFLPSDYYTAENYGRIFTDGLYWSILWRSLLGSLVVTAISLVFAFPYSYLMVRTPSALLRKFLLIALFLPFFIGQVVRAYGWLIILGNQGVVNEMLGLIGIEPMRLLYNYPAVLFGLVQYMIPFAVLMLAPALTAIPEEMESAANSLGANWWRTFVHVLLPMAKPGLVGAGLVVLTLSLTDFAMPAILGGGSQDFIANAIYDQFFRTSDQGMGAALTLILVGVGSLLVGIVFTLFGAGTLAMGREKK